MIRCDPSSAERAMRCARAACGVLVICVVIQPSPLAQNRTPIRPMARSNWNQPAPPELVAPHIPGVVAGGTKVQLVASGFGGGEGAIAMPDGSLLFSNLSDKLLRVDNEDRVSTYLDRANGISGLAFDLRGRLLAVGAARRSLAVVSPRPAAGIDLIAGEPLLRPNDVVVDSRGGVYFTDPNLDPGRRPMVYYFTVAGKLTVATDALDYPNGIQLSPDEKTAYASNGTAIVAFDVRADGALTNARIFAASASDGLAVDDSGRLYAALSFRWHPPTDVQGVRVFSPTGDVLGVIPTGVPPSSVAFAGPDKRTLYAVGAGGVQKVRMIAQGIQTRAK
jgi:gluconolactonase